MAFCKHSAAAGNYAWGITVTNANIAGFEVSTNGTAIIAAGGTSDIADDRWHHIAGTCDGTTIRLYVDGALEARTQGGLIASANGPVNVGAFGADSSAAAQSPHYGRVDEAFVTADVLTEDQIRNLYCARIPHGLIDASPAPIRPPPHPTSAANAAAAP